MRLKDLLDVLNIDEDENDDYPTKILCEDICDEEIDLAEFGSWEWSSYYAVTVESISFSPRGVVRVSLDADEVYAVEYNHAW